MDTKVRAKLPADFPPKAFFSPRDYSKLAGIHPSTVLDQIHGGKLYAVKLSQRVYRIPRAAVVATLYPEVIGEPRFGRSTDLELERILEEERRELEAEEAAARAAIAARRSRKADATSA